MLPDDLFVVRHIVVGSLHRCAPFGADDGEKLIIRHRRYGNVMLLSMILLMVWVAGS